MTQTAENLELRLSSLNNCYPELIERAEQAKMRLLGSVALLDNVQIENVESADSTTLLAALHEARFGDQNALQKIKNNAATDVAERLFKAGHQTEVRLEIDNHKLSQNGVRLTDIHKNTLTHMPLNNVMRRRTEQELRNALVYEELINSGVLATHDVVVLSPTPVDQKTRRDYNFFTDTDSLSIQYLKEDGGQFVMETAMVAGKKSSQAERHDLRAIRQIIYEAGGEIGQDIDEEALSHVILVRKTPDGGVHKIVERYDQIIGGTFYGEVKPAQDYEAYKETCRARDERFEPLVDKITAQLLREAHSFKTPLDAIKRLDRLSDQYCVEQAVSQHDIDARVFGSRAAAYIMQARQFMQAGDLENALQRVGDAQKVSTSGSCPLFRGDGSSGEPGKKTAGEDKYGSLDFECKNGHKNTRPKNQLIEKCKVCGVSVKC